MIIFLLLLLCNIIAIAVFYIIKKKHRTPTPKVQTEDCAMPMFIIIRKMAYAFYLYSHDNNTLGLHLKELFEKEVANNTTFAAISYLADYRYNEAAKHLSATHPDLSENEIGLCAMIMLSCTNQEICTLLRYKTINSVYVKKNKVKNKLGIKNDMSLELYLNEISATRN